MSTVLSFWNKKEKYLLLCIKKYFLIFVIQVNESIKPI